MAAWRCEANEGRGHGKQPSYIQYALHVNIALAFGELLLATAVGKLVSTWIMIVA
jgi:hypothetical protein